MIRPIVRDDIPFIVRSLQCMREESVPGKRSADDPEYVSGNLEAMFDSPDFFGYVYGEQHGYMFGAISALWFCSKLRAYEQSLFVKPEHRGSLAAPRLIKRFAQEAETRGAVEIYAGSYTEIKTDKLFRLYTRLGFERHGLGMIKRIQ